MIVETERTNETRAAQCRVDVRDIRIRLDFTLCQRRFGERLNGAARQRRLIIAEVGSRACEGHSAIDGEDTIEGVVHDLWGNAVLGTHTQNTTAAVHYDDNG